MSAILHGHQHAVIGVAISGDGNRIAAGNIYGRILSWEKDVDEWVMTKNNSADVGLMNKFLANERELDGGDVCVCDEVIEVVVGPLALEIQTTAFGFFITLLRKPYVAQIDILME